jgi:hypothetical protein
MQTVARSQAGHRRASVPLEAAPETAGQETMKKRTRRRLVREVTNPEALRAVASGKSLEVFVAELQKQGRLCAEGVSLAEAVELAVESYLWAIR